jgi:hypothetical protein
MVPKAEIKIVAVKTPLNGIPVLLTIAGLTTIIYIADKKVVIPAIISVFRFVLFSPKEKYLFNILGPTSFADTFS